MRISDWSSDVCSSDLQPLTPGVEQRNFWSSASAATVGSYNLAGIHDPAVDDLVEHIVKAPDRDALRTACRALDRVLMWGWYVIPHRYSGTVKLAWWDRFGKPAEKPPYATGLQETWWVDAARDRALNLQRQR